MNGYHSYTPDVFRAYDGNCFLCDHHIPLLTRGHLRWLSWRARREMGL